MTRRRPSDPQDIQRRRAERIANEREIDRLQSQGATVKLDSARRIMSAFRSNVFTRLLDSKTITLGQHDASETLRADWAAWKGLDGRPEQGEYVDGGSGSHELLTDRMINAGRKVERDLAQVGPMDRALLEAFMVATVEEDRPMQWRGIVERVTGATQAVRQSQMVVAALENLRRVYAEPRREVA